MSKKEQKTREKIRKVLSGLADLLKQNKLKARHVLCFKNFKGKYTRYQKFLLWLIKKAGGYVDIEFTEVAK